MTQEPVKKIDAAALAFSRRIQMPLARAALFIVYFWFGALKAAGMSPATPLVTALFDRTIGIAGVVSFPPFYGALAVFEMAISILFLMRGMERPVALLALLHLGMTSLPLALLPDIAWGGLFALTLEGQYIIKNILILALTVVVMSRARPLGETDRTAEVL